MKNAYKLNITRGKLRAGNASKLKRITLKSGSLSSKGKGLYVFVNSNCGPLGKLYGPLGNAWKFNPKQAGPCGGPLGITPKDGPLGKNKSILKIIKFYGKG